jgi:hypothetical protein
MGKEEKEAIDNKMKSLEDKVKELTEKQEVMQNSISKKINALFAMIGFVLMAILVIF